MSTSSYACTFNDSGGVFAAYRAGDKYELRILNTPVTQGVIMSEGAVRTLVACMQAYLGELADEAGAKKEKEKVP